MDIKIKKPPPYKTKLLNSGNEEFLEFFGMN
jgi:hypothetical protein